MPIARSNSASELGQKVILVREETKPEDIHGFFAAEGILTSRGGKTSHAAVVARGMGKPCVAGAEGISVDVNRREARVGLTSFKEGDVITIDGTSGKVYLGAIPTVEPDFTPELDVLLGWSDEMARLKVMANADTPEDARRARKYGAVGIGLARTERMFNDVERLPVVIEMIVAETPEAATGGTRQAAASAAQGLPRSVRGHGAEPGDHPSTRPADPRVPARRACPGARAVRSARTGRAAPAV